MVLSERAVHVLDTIKNRRSIRKYLAAPVEWDKVVTLLEAGRWSPSAGNLQEWRFIVVSDLDLKKKVADACLQQHWIEAAPLIIVIVSLQEKQIEYYGDQGKQYLYEDAAAAAQNMMLAATALDMGSCWIGAFDEQELRDALKIPDRATPYIVLTFGYADEKVPVPPRNPLEPLTYLQTFGNRVKNANLVMWDWSLEMERYAKAAKKEIKSGLRKFFDDVKKRMKK